MKLGDILGKLVGLDPQKDYEFSVTEQQVETPPAPPASDDSSSSRTESADSEAIKKMQDEIENLKKINLALLQRTPVESSDISIEQRIMELVMPHAEKGE